MIASKYSCSVTIIFCFNPKLYMVSKKKTQIIYIQFDPTHTCQVPLLFLIHTCCLSSFSFLVQIQHATQLPCLLLPCCSPSLNQAVTAPRSLSLWLNPKTHAAKSMLCTSSPDRTQKAWRSQSRCRRYLAKPPTMSKSKTTKSFIFLFRSAAVGFGDVLAMGFADVCFLFFLFFFPW